MKKLLIIALTFPLTAWAADLVVTIPAADVPRIQEAFGATTPQEVEQAVRKYLIEFTKRYEQRTFSPPPLEMSKAAPQTKAAPTATPKPKKK